MRIKLNLPANMPTRIAGVQCLKCKKLIGIVDISDPAPTLKAHVDSCLSYTMKEAKAEKARIDQEYAKQSLA